MRFRTQPVHIEAYQWFKNGDHPKDNSVNIPGSNGEMYLSEGEVVKQFLLPDMTSETACLKCSKKLTEHGWLEKQKVPVCPGNWIRTINTTRTEGGPEEYELLSNEDIKLMEKTQPPSLAELDEMLGSKKARYLWSVEINKRMGAYRTRLG